MFALGEIARILKGNPYHDATGAFTSKDKAVGGGKVPARDIAEAAASTEKPVETQPETSATPLGGPLRSRIIPTKENEEVRQRLTSYMEGYHKQLKNPQERAYVAERVRQMINGETRPKGMSAKFGLEKRRAIQFEALTYKIFQAGRKKIGL